MAARAPFVGTERFPPRGGLCVAGKIPPAYPSISAGGSIPARGGRGKPQRMAMRRATCAMLERGKSPALALGNTNPPNGIYCSTGRKTARHTAHGCWEGRGRNGQVELSKQLLQKLPVPLHVYGMLWAGDGSFLLLPHRADFVFLCGDPGGAGHNPITALNGGVHIEGSGFGKAQRFYGIFPAEDVRHPQSGGCVKWLRTYPCKQRQAEKPAPAFLQRTVSSTPRCLACRLGRVRAVPAGDLPRARRIRCALLGADHPLRKGFSRLTKAIAAR